MAPLQAVTETFTWELPDEVAPGSVTVTATVWYSRLVPSVAKYLHVPQEEWEPVSINSHSTTFTVL